MESKHVDAAKEIVSKGFDWESLIDLSLYHRVYPLVHWNLKRHAPTLAPETVATRLEGYFRANQRRIMGLTAELMRVTELLDAKNIETVALKGPVLGAMAYENVALRPAGDLDILVKPHDVAEALEVLKGCGYRVSAPRSTGELSDRQARVVDRFHYHHLLIHEEQGISIELHFRLFATKMLYFGPTAADAVDRRSSWTVAGKPVGVLNKKDYLIYLCVHGGKHAWARLEWIVSVAEFFRSFDASEEPELWKKAQQQGAGTALLLGAALAEHLFEVRTLPGLNKKASESSRVGKLLKLAVAGLDECESKRSFREAEADFQWNLCDSFRGRARWFVFQYFIPHGAEFRHADGSSRLPTLFSFWWVYRGLFRRMAQRILLRSRNSRER